MKTFCPKQRFDKFNCYGHVRSLRALLGVVAFCGFFALSGCAGFQIRTQTNTLSDSGFVARWPQTANQHEAYAALPPYQLQRGVAGGSVFYAYRNEKAGVVYLGGEEEYQRYMEKVRRLVAFYETTEAKMMAHDMDSNLQGLWYHSWGSSGASNPQN
jgi:hypothetical protein